MMAIIDNKQNIHLINKCYNSYLKHINPHLKTSQLLDDWLTAVTHP